MRIKLFEGGSSDNTGSGEDWDLVDSDIVVGETSEQEVATLVPCETGASDGGLALFVLGINGASLDVNNELLWGEIPDLDTGVGTEYEPVLLGGEENAVNGTVNFGLAQEFTFNEVPDDGETVLATWGEVRGLGGHIKRVNLSLVTDEGVLEGHGLVVPYLDGLVPWGADNDGGLVVLVEFNAWNPISVSVLFYGEFALTNSVPDLDVLVSATGSDLSVIGGESNCENISGVTNESLDGSTLFQVPEAESAVPWTGEAISAVLRKTQVTDEVRVT